MDCFSGVFHLWGVDICCGHWPVTSLSVQQLIVLNGVCLYIVFWTDFLKTVSAADIGQWEFGFEIRRWFSDWVVGIQLVV